MGTGNMWHATWLRPCCSNLCCPYPHNTSSFITGAQVVLNTTTKFQSSLWICFVSCTLCPEIFSRSSSHYLWAHVHRASACKSKALEIYIISECPAVQVCSSSRKTDNHVACQHIMYTAAHKLVLVWKQVSIRACLSYAILSLFSFHVNICIRHLCTSIVLHGGQLTMSVLKPDRYLLKSSTHQNKLILSYNPPVSLQLHMFMYIVYCYDLIFPSAPTQYKQFPISHSCTYMSVLLCRFFRLPFVPNSNSTWYPP